MRYPCDLSEYAATAISSLKHHKEAKHEGIKYPCDKYEFVPSNKLHLKRHKESKHEGLRYSCDPRINDCAEIKMKNVSVMVEKLNVSKYQSLLKNVKLEQQVLKKETNSDVMFAEIKVEDYSSEIPNDGNKDTCDLQTKIEIEEDLTIKTEPSDLSEFLVPSYKASLEESIYRNVSTREIKEENNLENYDISGMYNPSLILVIYRLK